MKETGYEDIIHLPHYEPKNHPRMPMRARAAQFAPFAALSGHSAAISKTTQAVEDSFDESNRRSRQEGVDLVNEE